MQALFNLTVADSTSAVFTALACVTSVWILGCVYMRLGRTANSYDNLKVFTFANHKGGVGKSTTAFFVAKELAANADDSASPTANVLVIDCSVYTDLTKLLCGRDRSSHLANHTVEAAARRAHAVEGSWFRSFNIKDYVTKVDSIKDTAPSNLYVMTNDGDESVEGMRSTHSDAQVSIVAQAMRKSLSKSTSTPWIVLIDTDGGTTHQLTKLALCVADFVVVPTNADAMVLDRIRVMLRLMESLRVKRFSNARISTVFFNQYKSKSNEPDGDAGDIGLGCAVHKETSNEMQTVVRKFHALKAEYPHLLKELEKRKDTGGREVFYTGVRDGGESMRKVMNTPYGTDKLSDAISGDIRKLARLIEQRAGRQPRFS